MNFFTKVITVILSIFLAIAELFGFNEGAVVKDNYFSKVTTDKALEQKYTGKGQYPVSSIKIKSDTKKIGKYTVWYPTEAETSTETYPLVIMANGSGVKASKYKPIFDHLASWGFIVVGNEDENSWDGSSTAASLDMMLKLNQDESSVFYNKIDLNNIGVAGHSQGGVGAINAVTAQDNGNLYKTIYTASTTHIDLAKGLNWSYDVSKINIPYFMVAGTLSADAGDGIEGSSNVGIAPLFSLQENFASISDDVMKIMARRVNIDHGDMLAFADGYMTAWFMYRLKDDNEAGKIFVGDDAEILTNANWQDIEKNF
ncbi:MAG: alpha/beta hydrolase [Acutalibacteraceae bacterium]